MDRDVEADFDDDDDLVGDDLNYNFGDDSQGKVKIITTFLG